MSSLRRVILGVALVLAVAAPATAETHDEPFVPNTPLTPVFLSCEGGRTPEWMTNAFLDDDFATWGPTAPASVTTGAGCGMFDDVNFGGTTPRTPYDLTFGGTYTGNLDTLNVTLHLIGAGIQSTGDPLVLELRMTIDGFSMFGVEENESVNGTISQSPATRTIQINQSPTGATGAVVALPFNIRGIDLMTEDDDIEHYVEFTLSTGIDTPNENLWVWGAAEAPTGVTFTPEAPAQSFLKADKRANRKLVI